MMVEHEHIEELIAARALGGLDPDGERTLARERESHGKRCPECLRLELEYSEVAWGLAFALDPVPLREGFEDELVAAATTDAGEPIALRPPSESRRESRRGHSSGRVRSSSRRGSGRSHSGRSRRSHRPGFRVRGWAAAAAAAVLVAAGGLGGFLIRSSDGGDPQLVRFLAQPDTQVAHFEGTGEGALALVYQPGRDTSYLVGSNLASPPEGRAYQLWMIDGDDVVPGPTFAPEDRNFSLIVGNDPSGADMMAVTIEREGGATAPTGDPVFQAPIVA
jgi:anti-sigma-K factor RskA